ncbi:MAG TPA: hypothetical protein VM364_17695 [Vicinamibacterales bacterium]|nr:hypothetical protein [Vicinamibacterales bacterium]
MRYLACLLMTLAAAPAFAQARPDRGFLAVNGGAAHAAGTLRESFTYEVNVETGIIEVEYPGATAGMFDGAAGFRVWRRLGLGAAVGRSAASGAAPITARVPHPLLDNRHRTVEGEASGISRAETAVYVLVYYDLPTAGRVRARVSAGPAFFSARQDIVETIETHETYPFDTAEFRRAVTREADGSGAGVHASLDVSWMFARRVGAGALLRYARGTVNLNAPGSRSVSSDVGGLQFGGGLRFTF